ncbi:MAG: AAA family ATPase [Actinomycetota bacterium]|nr:AAA family ATPase [Actinomycetota bacterium]
MTESGADVAETRTLVEGSRLTMRLFGPPRVEADGAPVEVDTRKATALLAYLATTEHPHARDSLAGLFWPDYDQSRAHAALRRTLSALKKGLGGRWVKATRSAISLDTEGAWLDVAEFRRLHTSARFHEVRHGDDDHCPECFDRLSEAADLYRDEFLAGFGLRDSPDFDDWQIAQAEALRRELAEVLERLVILSARRGDHRTAIAHARRWSDLDPLHEPAHRWLMDLYARSGDRSAALRRYDECLLVLDRELGVEPLEETVALYRAIKEERVKGPSSSHLLGGDQSLSSSRPPSPGELPLVGREREWRVLEDGYGSAGGDVRVLVIEGEPGVGKTRLAQDLLAHLASEGTPVIATRCYEEEQGLAFGPIVGCLRTALAFGEGAWLHQVPARVAAELGRLVPDVYELRPELSPSGALENPAAKSLFFDAVIDAITAALAGSRPGVVFVDDLQWIDDSSLELLVYLVRRLRDRPIRLLLAWRTGDLSDRHRVRSVIAEAERAGAAAHVVLGRLSPQDVDAVVAAVAPRTDLGRRLFEETEGLPFFLNEYLSVLAGAPEAGWEIPVGVRELLRSRLAGLSRAAQQVLGAAAVIGRGFEIDVMRETSGRSEEEVVAGIEELMQRALLREVAGSDSSHPSYDFAHAKMRTLIYEDLGLARRRLLHRRAAEGSLRTRRADRDGGVFAASVARHFQHAGDNANAALWFKTAGDHDRRLFANAEARAHLEGALALGYPGAAELHEAIGDLDVLLGDYEAARTSFERAAARLEGSDAAPRLQHKLGLLHQRMGEWEIADAHLDAALASLGEDDVAARARIYADRSLSARQRGALQEAEEDATTALELAERAGAADALAQAHNILGMVASKRGDLVRARDHLEASLVLADDVSDPSARVAAMNNLALAWRAEGSLDQAIELTESALDLCSEQGDRHREAALHNNLADLLHARGDKEAALAHVKRSAAMFADVGLGGGMEPAIWRLVEW